MTWLQANLDLVVELVIRHLRLSVPPIILGLLLAIGPGVLAWRYRRIRGIVLASFGLLYTIPSLALFVLLPPLLGIPVLGELNVIIAMTLYALALLTRSVTESLVAVDEDVRLAADAIGYSPAGRFRHVELPLAAPVLLAGLRVVSVSTVSLVTVGVLVGIRSLGYLFMDGLQRSIPAEIVTGIVATVVIALLLDGLLLLLGRIAMPWQPRPARRRVTRLRRRTEMRAV